MLRTCVYHGLRSLLKFPVGRIFAKVPVTSPSGDSGGRHCTSGQSRAELQLQVL